MKRTNLFIAILLCLSITISLLSINSVKAADAKLYVDPPSVTIVESNSFTISLKVQNVTDLFAWGARLSWDASLLDVTAVTEGPFLKGQPEGTFFVKKINQTFGYVDIAVTTAGDHPGVDGNGTLATATFLAETWGTTVLNLSATSYIDHLLNDIPHDVSNGFVTSLGRPIASFSFTPTQPAANQTVTFDASASYDPDGTIMNYTWDFNDGTITNTTDPITTHVFSAQGSYNVTLTATDNDGIQTTTWKIVPAFIPLVLEPNFGPVGTKVTLTGHGFPPDSQGELYYDDHFITLFLYTDLNGTFTLTFNIPLSEPGPHKVQVYNYNYYPSLERNETTFTVIDTTPLDLSADVGQIHFRGEMAEFYVQTAFKGSAITPTSLEANLYKPSGTPETLTASAIATGFYKFPYNVPLDAPAGTYALEVKAGYTTNLITSAGTTFKTFLLSPTLTEWNAKIINIDENITLIKTDIGLIKADISILKANITTIDGDIATIQTTLGTINGTINSIKNDVATIKTDVGTIKSTLQGWTGGTISSIVTPQGTFKILVLTRSTLTGLEMSDHTVEITVTGESGTSGVTNLIVPKKLLTGIGSAIGKLAITIDDNSNPFTYTEQQDVYVLHTTYTHSTHMIKVYLEGLPPPTANIWMILAVLAVILAVAGITLYLWKIRKRPTTKKTAEERIPKPSISKP